LWKKNGWRDKTSNSNALPEGRAAQLSRCLPASRPARTSSPTARKNTREGADGASNTVRSGDAQRTEVLEVRVKEGTHLVLRCAGGRAEQSPPDLPLPAPGRLACKAHGPPQSQKATPPAPPSLFADQHTAQASTTRFISCRRASRLLQSPRGSLTRPDASRNCRGQGEKVVFGYRAK